MRPIFRFFRKSILAQDQCVPAKNNTINALTETILTRANDVWKSITAHSITCSISMHSPVKTFHTRICKLIKKQMKTNDKLVASQR